MVAKKLPPESMPTDDGLGHLIAPAAPADCVHTVQSRFNAGVCSDQRPREEGGGVRPPSHTVTGHRWGQWAPLGPPAIAVRGWPTVILSALLGGDYYFPPSFSLSALSLSVQQAAVHRQTDTHRRLAWRPTGQSEEIRAKFGYTNRSSLSQGVAPAVVVERLPLTQSAGGTDQGGRRSSKTSS